MRRKAQIERFLENCIYYNLKGVENMKEELYKIVIQGNELYEIDLECMEKRKKGKNCSQNKDSAKTEERKRRGEL